MNDDMNTKLRTQIFWVTVCAVHLALVIYIYLLSGNEQTFLGMSQSSFLTWALLIYDMLSIFLVKPDGVGARTVLDYPINGFGPGPHYVPLLLCRIYRDTARTIQVEFPGEPGRIWHGEPDQRPGDIDPKTGEDVYVLPYRIPTGYPKKGDDKPNEPLNVQGTVEPSVLTRYQIWKPKYVTHFIKNIVTLKEVRRQIEDTIAGILQEEFSYRTVGKIIEEIHVINKRLKIRIDTLVEEWGIVVKDISIKTVGLSHELNKKLRDVANAKAEALMVIISAEAEKKRLIKEGEGNAKAELLLKLAKADGLKGIATALKIPEKDALELFRGDVAQTALQQVENLTMFTGGSDMGLAQLFGLAEALKKK